MDVKDSNRMRRRIVAFLLSQDGRVNGGQNDGLVRWIYEKIARGEYKHERVGDLKDTLIAMEQAGLVVLEWAVQKGTRLRAVGLAAAANVETVDEEDFDLFNGSNETLRMLVLILQGRNKKLEQEVQDSEQAFEEMAAEGCACTIVPVKQPVSVICDHQAEIQALIAAREAQLRLQHQGDLRRQKGEYEQRLQTQRTRYATYREEVNLHKSQCGHELAQLRQQLARTQQAAYQA